MAEFMAAEAWDQIFTPPQTKKQRNRVLAPNCLLTFSLFVQSRTPLHITLRTDLSVKPLWKLSQTLTQKRVSLKAKRDIAEVKSTCWSSSSSAPTASSHAQNPHTEYIPIV